MKINCCYCGKESDKPKGAVTRASKINANLYCDKKCAGLARRSNKSKEQKVKEKAEYDRKYRKENRILIRDKKRKWEQSPSGRASQKRNREKFKESHLEYCRTPEYRKWKKQYDLKYRAKKNFGEFWESAILINQIEEIIPNREVMQQLQLINKSQKRKRSYEKFKREELERSTMGNPK